MANESPKSISSPPVREGFTRFSSTAVDIKWSNCPIGFELFGRWLGWRPSIDPSWNALGAMEVDHETKVFPLVTALRVLMRVPRGTPLALIYLGKKPSKRGGKSYHDFALDYPEGTLLLPPSADPEADKRFLTTRGRRPLAGRSRTHRARRSGRLPRRPGRR